ncbi:MAG: hypothetical protein H5U08_14380, partial [Thermogutta sp.]|uniref:hypothetical protein n=1 Tax=Thermogutta sp. TaxID=1962930 RepID=UPI0019CA37B4
MALEHNCLAGKVGPRCCPCHETSSLSSLATLTRRAFLGSAAIGSTLLSGLSWGSLAAQAPDLPMPPPRQPLKVKPVFLYRVYQRRPQTSWRPWGGIQTEEAASQEVARIREELKQLQASADFPVEFAPLTATKDARQLSGMEDVQSADVLLVYANDGDLNAIAALKKDTIFFVRHKSGPLYL